MLSKEEWDFIQRLVLLLQSDAELEKTTKRRCSIRQLIAACALGLFVWCSLWLGFGYQTIAVVAPFGLISIMLSYWKDKIGRLAMSKSWNLLPFSSLAELMRVRRMLPGFSKHRYPPHLKTRKIRGAACQLGAVFNAYALWMFASPLVLFFQIFPDKEVIYRVVLPA